MKLFGVYARLSMRGEDAESIKRQIAQGTSWVQANHYDPVLYVEPEGHRSGRSEKQRPKWRELKADLKADKLAGVWVADLARASRNVREFLEFLDLCAKHNVTLISDKEHIDTDTAAGKMLITVLCAFNEWYAADIGERQKRAIQHRKSEGGTWGQLPLGLKRDEHKKLVASDETYTAPDGSSRRYLDTVVAWLELLTRKDVGTYDGALELSLRGYRWKGRDRQPCPVDPWHLAFLNSILSRYRGIIDDGLLSYAMRQVERRSGHQMNSAKRKEPPPLLAKVLVCAECGKRYVSKRGSSPYVTKSGEHKRVYFTRYVHRGVNCRQYHWQASFMVYMIDDQVIAEVEKCLTWTEEDRQRFAAEFERPTTAPSAIAPAEIERRLDRLKMLFEMGDLELEDYARRRDELRAMLRADEALSTRIPFDEALARVESFSGDRLRTNAEHNKQVANLWFREVFESIELQYGRIKRLHPHEAYRIWFDKSPLCA